MRKVFSTKMVKLKDFAIKLICSKRGLAVGLSVVFVIGLLVLLAAFLVFRKESTHI
jgi:hypothetical protein